MYDLLVILAAPMLASSVQTAMETPGLPLGLADVPAGWKRRVLQVAIVIFFPITILLLRLQYQLTLKRWEVAKESQDYRFFGEFNRLSSLLTIMEDQKRKREKMDVSFEVTHEIALGIMMVLFAKSQTKTTSGLEALFQIEGEVEVGGSKLGIGNLELFIGSTILSFASFLHLFTASNAGYWSWKSKVF